MFHKVRSVSSLSDDKLSVQFAEGVTKEYDLSGLQMHWLENGEMIDIEFTGLGPAQVSTGGYGIIWDDIRDLSCNELWENGQVVETAFDGLMAFSDATELWGLNESTLRKAVAYGKLIAGRDVCKFGKQWVITREAMEREYGEPKAA